jgi:hypothetical protein
MGCRFAWFAGSVCLPWMMGLVDEGGSEGGRERGNERGSEGGRWLGNVECEALECCKKLQVMFIMFRIVVEKGGAAQYHKMPLQFKRIEAIRNTALNCP